MSGRTDTASLLRKWGALLEHDHFVYISGQHGPGWIDKDIVYPHTERTSELAARIAAQTDTRDVALVCGPATGGLILAQWVAHHRGLLAVFGEHAEAADADGRRPFVLRRGYDRLVAGRSVLVVDDVINTGLSIRGVIEAVRRNGGVVRTAACVCNRGTVAAEDLGVQRLITLAEIRLASWPRDECPLCRDGVPVNTAYAHGADYLAAAGNWP